MSKALSKFKGESKGISAICYDRAEARLKGGVGFMVRGTIKSFGAVSLGDQQGASEVLDPGFWLSPSRCGVQSKVEFVQMRRPLLMQTLC